MSNEYDMKVVYFVEEVGEKIQQKIKHNTNLLNKF